MAHFELLTQSRLKSARACRRQHDFRYRKFYRAVQSAEEARFGTLCHGGLEVWFGGWKLDPETRLFNALDFLDMQKADPFDVAKARAMLRAYHYRWKDEPWETLAVERQFIAPLINPATGASSRIWMLAGKLDAVVRNTVTGRVLIVEHKTSSEDLTPGGRYMRRLRMDNQITVYFVGAKACGFPVDACIYDVLGKPGQKPLQATPEEARKYTKPTKADPVSRLYANQRDRDETPDEYEARCLEAIAAKPEEHLVRVEVPRLDQDMHDGLLDIWQLAKELRESELAGRNPRNPDACDPVGGFSCPFFDVCTGQASIDDPTRFSRGDSAHPELDLSEFKQEVA